MLSHVIVDEPFVLFVDREDNKVRVLTTVQASQPSASLFKRVDGCLEQQCWEEKGMIEVHDSDDFLLGKAFKSVLILHPECDDPGCGRWHKAAGYSGVVKFPEREDWP